MENFEYKNSPSYFYIKNSAIKDNVSFLTMFCCDCNLPYDLFDVYYEGMILREPRFFKVSAVMGEITATHRYIILSNRMIADGINGSEFIVDGNSRFLVLTKGSVKDKRFTALLHLDDGWQHLKSLGLDFAGELITACRSSFEKCIKSDRGPLDRDLRHFITCDFPIGMTELGDLFPIED